MDIKKKLYDMRKARKLSRADVASYLSSRGFKTSYKMVSNWEAGSTRIDVERFVELCALFEVYDVPQVFGDIRRDSDPLRTLARKSGELCDYINLLEKEGGYVKRQAARAVTSWRLPIYDLPVSAGTGQFLDGESYEFTEVSDPALKEADFALRVSGDSMQPRISDGQVIYVKKQQTLNDGEIGIFILNGDAYCKKLEGNSLISFNSKYKPIIINEYDNLIVLGKLIN